MIALSRWLRGLSSRLRRAVRRTKNWSISSVTRLALACLGRLSLEQALRAGDIGGALLFRVLAEPRRLALEHLEIALGDSTNAAARVHLARASFINVARCFCELAKIDAIRARADEYFEIDGAEHIDAARALQRGAVIITGHIGNWELLAAYWAWTGVPIVALARRIYAERLNQLIVELRRRQGVDTVLRESPSASAEILAAIKRNALLAMVIDQDTCVQSVSVPFFGRLARTPTGAASLAIRRELPVLAVFIQRRPTFGHRITVLPAFAVLRTEDMIADIRALTRTFNETIERQTRKNPAEWVWWHRRAPRRRLDLNGDFAYTTKDIVLP